MCLISTPMGSPLYLLYLLIALSCSPFNYRCARHLFVAGADLRALLKRSVLGLVNLNNTKWALNRTENEAAYSGAYCSQLPLSAHKIITRRERK